MLVSMWLGYIWTSIKNNDSKMCLWFFFHQSMIFTSEDVCMLFIWSLQTPTCKIWRRAHRLCSSFKSKPDTSFVLHMYFMMFRLVKQFANAVCFRRLPWCCVFIQMLIHWKKWTFVVKKKFKYLHYEAFSVLWRLPENSNGINSFKTVCLLI